MNFWVSNLEKQNLHVLINKNIMALVAILSVNPNNQNEKIKENFNYIIEKLIALVKKSKKKTKKEINPEDLLEEEDELEDGEDEENDDKFAKVKFIFS